MFQTGPSGLGILHSANFGSSAPKSYIHTFDVGDQSTETHAGLRYVKEILDRDKCDQLTALSV